MQGVILQIKIEVEFQLIFFIIVNNLIIFYLKMGKAKIEKGESTNNSKNKFEKKNKGGIKYVKNKKMIVNDGTKQLRNLYNKLMLKDKKDKTDLIKKILSLIDGKFEEICYKHDGCRILQGSIKYGSKEQKKLIISKLIPMLYNIINGKYSIYLASKIFKYADNNQRKEILEKVIIPNFKHLLKYSGGISFTKIIFSFSTSSYIDKLIDYYIKDYFKIPMDKIKKLSSENEINNENEDIEMKNENIIINNSGNEIENEETRKNIKVHLEKQLELGVSKNFIFHGFLNKIFDLLDEKTQIYITELFDDDFTPFLDNNYGFELACKLYSVSEAKTRKKIIKTIRENLDNYLSNDNGTYFIIKIILFTDDTVFINKIFLKAILEKLNESLMNNKNCLKIIWNIFFPFNHKCNNTTQRNILAYSKPFGNKKDLEKRQNELIQNIFDKIYKLISYDIKDLIKDYLFSNFLTDFIQYLLNKKEIEKIEELLNTIISIIENDFKDNKDTLDNCILIDKIGQITIKRILKEFSEAKGEGKKYEITFAEKISNLLKSELDKFLNSKAIFIIVQLMENENTKKFIMDDLKKFKSLIMKNKDNKKLAGMVLLAKLI